MNHVIEIVDDFLAKNLHAECSCGWEGSAVDRYEDAVSAWTDHVVAEQGPTIFVAGD